MNMLMFLHIGLGIKNGIDHLNINLEFQKE
jgi:hypothetical protein